MKRLRKRPPRGDATGPGTAWAEVREIAAGRSGGVCEWCGQPFECVVDDAGSVLFVFDGHHRKLRSQGGPDIVANCVALCRSCHRWIHDHPVGAQQRGFICPSGRDPRTWPIWLHDQTVAYLADDGSYDTGTGEAA